MGTGWLTRPIPNIIGFLLSDQHLEDQCWSAHQIGGPTSSAADLSSPPDLPANPRLCPQVVTWMISWSQLVSCNDGQKSRHHLCLHHPGRWSVVVTTSSWCLSKCPMPMLINFMLMLISVHNYADASRQMLMLLLTMSSFGPYNIYDFLYHQVGADVDDDMPWGQARVFCDTVLMLTLMLIYVFNYSDINDYLHFLNMCTYFMKCPIRNKLTNNKLTAADQKLQNRH